MTEQSTNRGRASLAAGAFFMTAVAVVAAMAAGRPYASAQPVEGESEIVFTEGAFNRDLFAVRPSAGGPPLGRRLTDTPGISEGAPDWAPDAARVAYTAGRDDGPVAARSAIWVIDTRTAEHAPASFGPDDDAPDWSPDGRLIAFVHVLERGRTLQSSTISIVDPSAPEPAPIFEPLEDTTALVSTPKWSPDGRRIAFVVAGESGGDLYLARADGTEARRLLEHPGWDDIDPAWSPDGRLIAFASGFHREPGASRPNPRHGIWLLDVTEGTLGLWLADPSLDLRQPAWSPDGHRIVFEARSTTGAGETSLRTAEFAAGAGMSEPLVAGAEPDWSRPAPPPTPTPVQSPTATSEAPPTATFPATSTPPGIPGETPIPTLPPFPTLPPPGPTVFPPSAPTFPLPSATPGGGGAKTPTATPTTDPRPSPSPSPSPSPGEGTGTPRTRIHLPVASTGR